MTSDAQGREGEAKFLARLEYSYDKSTQVWHLNYCRNPLKIDRLGTSVEADADISENVREIMHGKLPRLFVKNHLICQKVDDGKSIYGQNGVTLPKYIRGSDSDLVMIYNIPASGVEVDDRKMYFDIPDVFRGFLKSMLSFVIHLNYHGMALISLDLFKNFCVVEDELIFKDLDVTLADEKSKVRDLDLLSKVIKDLFSRYSVYKEPTKEVNDLLSLIDISHKDFNQELLSSLVNEDPKVKYKKELEVSNLLLLNHISVLSTSERLHLIRNFHEKKIFLSSNKLDSYMDAIDEVEFTKDWWKKLDGRNKRYGPILKCFTYLDMNKESSANHSLVAFWRHISVHSAEHLVHHLKWKSSLSKKHDQAVTPTEDDIDRLIMAFYGKDLMKLMRKLAKEDLLRLFV